MIELKVLHVFDGHARNTHAFNAKEQNEDEGTVRLRHGKCQSIYSNNMRSAHLRTTWSSIRGLPNTKTSGSSVSQVARSQ